MDFFEQQDVARRSTVKLIVLMILAVVGIVALTYPVACIAIMFAVSAGSEGEQQIDPNVFLQPQWIIAVTLMVSMVVVFGSLFKISQLRAGGRVVADMLGGRLIPANTTDPEERKILNVVEEMAIASGTPVPPVYIMDHEQGINAFAAGYTPDDAVIGVTRGSVRLLSRDELQGVMAHEFSHILNGDMRMNIRLIGIVHGILVIGLIGWAMIRIAFYSGLSSGRRRDNDKGNAGAILGIIGLALVLLGFIGVFFGNWIKAAVSRQREFLADSSAVQFTRNPEGISGALQKIGGLSSHGVLESNQAQEVSHMFFAEGVTHLLGGMMATHPPLPQRIQRIDPRWDGVFPSVSAPDSISPKDRAFHEQIKKNREQEEQRKERMMQILVGGAVVTEGMTMAERIQAVRQQAMQKRQGQTASQSRDNPADQVGQVSEDNVAYAQLLLDSMPESLREAAREPFGARAVVYALLLDGWDEKVKLAQMDRLHAFAERGVPALVKRLLPDVMKLDDAARMPLLGLTLGSLRQLSEKQYEQFRQNLTALIQADDKTSLFEWMLLRMMQRHLAPTFKGHKRASIQYYNLRGVQPEISVLLSTLAYVGHQDMDDARASFEAAKQVLELDDVTLLDTNQCGLKPLGEALDKLETVALRVRKNLITAASKAIAHDGEVTLKEGELLRAICDSLDCPMPPMLPGQNIA